MKAILTAVAIFALSTSVFVGSQLNRMAAQLTVATCLASADQAACAAADKPEEGDSQ
jgi:hypothetical protein